MTKYYCDLCGREVQSVEEYMLPDLKDKESKTSQDFVIRRSFTYVPTKMELCRDCRGIVGNFVHIIKNTPAKIYTSKKITKIEWE